MDRDRWYSYQVVRFWSMAVPVTTIAAGDTSATLIGGSGSDLLSGGVGDDTILARDDEADTISGARRRQRGR